MDVNGIWRGFVETGDPVCYLLAKRMERPPRRNGAEKPKKEPAGDGDTPRPSD